MSELTESHITLIISSSFGGFFLSVISYILRKYLKSSKCTNALGTIEIESHITGPIATPSATAEATASAPALSTTPAFSELSNISVSV